MIPQQSGKIKFCVMKFANIFLMGKLCAKLETMTELLSILYKLRIFTLDELSEALKGKVKSVEALLARYKQQGWIVTIRRNTYFATTSKR